MDRLRIAIVISVIITTLVTTTDAQADGGRGVTVQPLTPGAGDVITVTGDLLGPNSEVEVLLIGMGVEIDLGEVQADAEGDFSAEFQLPDDLTPGTYVVEATGDESASTQITISGGGTTMPGTMQEEPVLRERSLGESIALVTLFGVIAALGILFARFTRRPHDPATA